jgi:hypothetical protein
LLDKNIFCRIEYARFCSAGCSIRRANCHVRLPCRLAGREQAIQILSYSGTIRTHRCSGKYYSWMYSSNGTAALFADLA